VTGYFGSLIQQSGVATSSRDICEGSRRSSNTGGGAASPAPLTPTGIGGPEALNRRIHGRVCRSRLVAPVAAFDPPSIRPVEDDVESRTAIPERPGQQIRNWV